ncbi:MAG: 50S ribosomal protein L9 [Actinomycetota bacterium]|nr:50S ribosomal protein L9 [Actinomycetota bacterium]
MKVVLRADHSTMGKRGDIVEVADGFARNYLLPGGLAIPATGGIEHQASSMRRARDVKDAKDREGAEAIARRLVPVVITVPARAGAEGKLFGSVTTHDIVEAIQEQTGIELDRRRVISDETIKSLGTHEVGVRLHAEVEFRVTVEVVRAG